jgi:Tfp pilus assembly protein FimV
MQGGKPDEHALSAAKTAEVEELSQRILENGSEISRLRQAIEANEVAQQAVQARIDGTIEGQGSRNPKLLKMLKQFRLQVSFCSPVPG